MRTFKYSLDEIVKIAEELVQTLPDRAIVLLDAEMGTGKTTLIGHLLQVWGVTEVSSPTYSICNVYQTKEGKTVHHYDFYRIRDFDELIEIGFQDMLETADYHFIEWPELGEPFFEAPIRWQIKREDNLRILTIL